MPIVEISGLIKDYGKLRAVDGISLEIERGECFGFLGPNGAGKTSVMKMIYCFFPPSSGTIKVFGMDVTQQPGEIKMKIGVTPQEDNLDPDLSVIENLVVYAKYFDIPKGVSLPHAKRLLEFFDLGDKSDVNIKDLSGGMQRKLVQARSLINNPELLIMDEPTTGLDPHSRRSVWDNLRRLMAEQKTIIITTHYMEEASTLCDRVAIMHRGRIVTIDTPASLMQIHGGTLEDVYIKLTGSKLIEH